ncbi:MAG TPA: hypothetical protein VKR23_15035 [Gaiellaceae bacterium]|nr:hypothetical protein [Gaiellaceae bacterium]
MVAMRQFLSAADETPAATWVIGHDDSRPGYTVLYSDGRGVSRVYEMRLEGDVWRIWRDDPDFSQRFEARIAADRDRITGTWKKRHVGGGWEHDFDVDYVRA